MSVVRKIAEERIVEFAQLADKQERLRAHRSELLELENELYHGPMGSEKMGCGENQVGRTSMPKPMSDFKSPVPHF